MSDKEKPLAKITIDVCDGVVHKLILGDAYHCLIGLSIAVNSVIENVPEAIQESTRAEFLRLLNAAASGRLFLEE